LIRKKKLAKTLFFTSVLMILPLQGDSCEHILIADIRKTCPNVPVEEGDDLMG
jgi:hypothetical protein